MMSNRLEETKKQLEKNNFEVFVTENSDTARELFINTILPGLKAENVSYADSLSMHKTKVLDYLRNHDSIEYIDTFNHDDSWRTQIMQRKKALTCDLFLTGTNAITESGHLVNLDMIGNRTSALTFGPRNVVLFVGKNKIVKDLDAAFKRVKEIAAPMNAKRHKDLKVPCQVTGKCMDCQSPQRICNTWSITEKSYPKKRIKIILIDESLGY